jgi:hypothetical protein
MAIETKINVRSLLNITKKARAGWREGRKGTWFAFTSKANSK